MATEMKQEDYLSHHYDAQYRKRLMGDTKIQTYESSEKPAASRPMSFSRKISAAIITVSHIFSLYALYDLLFVLEAATAIKWFIAAMVLYYVTGVQGITAGAHRLWAHRSYKAAWPVRLWLMLMNSCANQASIITWATEHRIHHIHVDTDADPHNINRGLFYAHMGWLFSPRTDAFAEAKKEVEVRDLYEDQIIAFQDKHYVFFGPVFCYLLPTLAGLYFGGDAWRGFLHLANLRWVVCLHCTWNINSLSHYYGDRPYRDDMKATENLVTSIFSGGEGSHNFHHAYPADYRAAEQESMFKWGDSSGVDWRYNGARAFIDFYALLGGVYDRKVCRVKRIGQH